MNSLLATGSLLMKNEEILLQDNNIIHCEIYDNMIKSI